MIYPTYKGKPVIPSKTVFNELMRCDVTLADAAIVLENGFDCARSRRKKGIIEKCIIRGNKTLKIVAAESYNHTIDAGCWVLIHVGVF